MNASEQIAKLESLLARIQRNAAKPRVAAQPAVTAQPAVVAAPEPAPAAMPAPQPPSDDAVPIPLVAVAPASRAPEEVAAVPVATEAPAVEVQTTSDYPIAEELTEDDLVEINSQPPPAALATPEPEPLAAAPVSLEEPSVPEPSTVAEPPTVPRDELDFEEEDETAARAEPEAEPEQPPASSKRPKVPTSMDEALAAAAAQLGTEEHEVPIKTPPPESGPQEAVPLPAGLSPAPLPDVDDMLEAEVPAARGPTPEQLGETIELDETRGPDLELDLAPQPTPPPVSETSELEAPLPQREAHGSYDAELRPPPEARQELEAYTRPPAPQGEVARVVSPEPSRARTFVELLDASIALGKS